MHKFGALRDTRHVVWVCGKFGRPAIDACPPSERDRLVRGHRTGAESASESLDAPTGVDDLLLARVERMAGGTDLQVDVPLEGRTRLDDVAATARRGELNVLRMYVGLHLGWVLNVRLAASAGAQSIRGVHGKQARKQARVSATSQPPISHPRLTLVSTTNAAIASSIVFA